MADHDYDPFDKKSVPVLDGTMAYVERGSGDPIVFVHGNPTSSYLWRNVIPRLTHLGRCIAPDLIGMGDSAKVASGRGAYRFADHRRYLAELLEVLGVESNVTFVAHDWGGPLAFDWARQREGSMKAVAYMETIVTPVSWDDWPESARSIFKAMRSDAGEEIILEKNIFVERILPASVLRPLAEEVMDVYRAPYLIPGESRRPTLAWPREVPIDGDPPDVVEAVLENEKWMSTTGVPKLFVNAEPGSILTGRQREKCRTWPNQTEVTVEGIHFIQEDSGEAIGEAIASWLESASSTADLT